MVQSRHLVLMGPNPSVGWMGLGACYPKMARLWAGAPDGTDFAAACRSLCSPSFYGVLRGLG